MAAREKESEALLAYSDQEQTWHTDKSQEKHHEARRSRSVLLILLCCNTVLFIISMLVLSSFLRNEIFAEQRNPIWRKANAYSPIVAEIDIPLSLNHMKGTFLNEDNDIFRQAPSPEVDAAWGNLTDHGLAYVSAADITKMGKDPAVVAKYGPEFGLGSDAYAVETDIIHKIHCLNMIRKDVHFEYYWRDTYPDGKVSERHKWHTNHCLYILLQALICDANTDLIPQVWLKDYPWATPDFNINRKCGNFEAVKEWERTHRVDDKLRHNMPKPHGQQVLPMSDELQRILEVEPGWDAKNGV